MAQQIDSMSWADYFAHPAINASLVKKFALLPAQKAHWEELNDTTSSPAMALGTVAHSAILEPLGIEKTVLVAEKPNLRTKAGKERRDELESEAVATGRQLVWQEDFESVLRMRDAVHAHPAARAILQEGLPEVTLLAHDPEFGVELKARQDWQPANIPLIPDLKTTRDARPWAFRNQALSLGYHIAAYHYQRVHQLTHDENRDTCWIAVEPVQPHLVAVLYPSDEMLLWGEHQWHQGMQRLLECRATNTYPGLGDEPQALALPGWARQEAVNAGVIDA